MKQHSLKEELVSDSLLHRIIAFESILRPISLVSRKKKKSTLFFFYVEGANVKKKKIHTAVF